MNAEWVEGFNPYRQQGRFFVRVPFSDGNADMFVQYNT